MIKYIEALTDYYTMGGFPKPQPTIADSAPGRVGNWMQTSLGGKFFPADPRPEEIFISDIANGLALICRYGGQGSVNHFYSVAEHSYLMALYAREVLNWPADAVLATLLHDASEAYMNDLVRAVKQAVNGTYSALEARIQAMIFEKYRLTATAAEYAVRIKELDNRIVPTEKAAIMRYDQPWAHDRFPPLDVVVKCYTSARAKAAWISMYVWCAITMNLPEEVIEL
jgi:hypothetical protein